MHLESKVQLLEKQIQDLTRMVTLLSAEVRKELRTESQSHFDFSESQRTSTKCDALVEQHSTDDKKEKSPLSPNNDPYLSIQDFEELTISNPPLSIMKGKRKSEMEGPYIPLIAAFQELLETEKLYLRDLEVLFDVYYHPLSESKTLNSQQMSSIFSNASEICNLHQMMWKELAPFDLKYNSNQPTEAVSDNNNNNNNNKNESHEVNRMSSNNNNNNNNNIKYNNNKYNNNSDKVVEDIAEAAQVFLKYSEFFKSYTVFCASQEKAPLTIADLKKNNKSFINFLNTSHHNPKTRMLPFDSFLITPVQRVCRYPLLFTAIVKYIPPQYPHLAEVSIFCSFLV